MRRSRTVQDRIFIAKNRSMSRMAKPMILPAMLPSFPSWMHIGQFPAVHAAASHAARAAGKIRFPLLYSVLEKEFQIVHGRFHAIDDDFPVNGECGKRRPGLFRNGLLNLHLRIDTQMGQCLESIGAQGVSRVGPAVKKLNPGHGAGYVRNASVWEDSSSNK